MLSEVAELPRSCIALAKRVTFSVLTHIQFRFTSSIDKLSKGIEVNEVILVCSQVYWAENFPVNKLSYTKTRIA